MLRNCARVGDNTSTFPCQQCTRAGSGTNGATEVGAEEPGDLRPVVAMSVSSGFDRAGEELLEDLL